MNLKFPIITIVLFLSTTLVACGGHHNPVRGQQNVGKKAAVYAERMVGIRYKFGGTSPRQGFDCSGLIQYSYRKAGVLVARSTVLQRKNSSRISMKNLRPGDLVFFNQLGKSSSHVGMYLGNNRFIHAPSSGKRIRIDSLKNSYWQRHLNSARRFHRL